MRINSKWRFDIVDFIWFFSVSLHLCQVFILRDNMTSFGILGLTIAWLSHRLYKAIYPTILEN